MITAKYGTKQFSVSKKKIYTPDGISIGESLEVEETEVSGKKPTTKVKGIKLQEVRFDVKLDNRFVDVITEIRWWKSALHSKKSKYLTIGSYRIGAFYLTDYNVTNIVMNKNGKYTKADLSLTFKEDGYFALNKTINFQNSGTKIGTISSIAIKYRVGSKVKIKSGTRRYNSAYSAIDKRGKSVKNTKTEIDNVTYKIVAMDKTKKALKVEATITDEDKLKELKKVSNSSFKTSVSSKKVTIKGWIRVEDMSVITY